MRKGRDEKKKTGKKEKTDENSGHYVIPSSRPPERRPLERRTLAPKERRCQLRVPTDWNADSSCQLIAIRDRDKRQGTKNNRRLVTNNR